jgi:hypothetical protein
VPDGADDPGEGVQSSRERDMSVGAAEPSPGLNALLATNLALEELAMRIVTAAEDAGLTLRVLGGVAVFLRCPTAKEESLARLYRDIDLMGLAGEGARLESLFASLGLAPERRFNALHGHRRLMFRDAGAGHTIDVLLDRFDMCHRLDLRKRLKLEPLTLPPADLLLTKLQVVEAEEKDVVDALTLVIDHPLGSEAGGIDVKYIATLCARDWGLYTTIERNLLHLSERARKLEPPWQDVAFSAIERLQEEIAAEPKTARWRARAAVGTRRRWYNLPEEVG